MVVTRKMERRIFICCAITYMALSTVTRILKIHHAPIAPVDLGLAPPMEKSTVSAHELDAINSHILQDNRVGFKHPKNCPII